MNVIEALASVIELICAYLVILTCDNQRMGEMSSSYWTPIISIFRPEANGHVLLNAEHPLSLIELLASSPLNLHNWETLIRIDFTDHRTSFPTSSLHMVRVNLRAITACSGRNPTTGMG